MCVKISKHVQNQAWVWGESVDYIKTVWYHYTCGKYFSFLIMWTVTIILNNLNYIDIQQSQSKTKFVWVKSKKKFKQKITKQRLIIKKT